MNNEPAKRGRPSDYTQELADRICRLIGIGMSLRSVLEEEEDMPVMSTVWKWLREHEDFSKQYVRATEERTEAQQEYLIKMGEDAVNTALTVDPKSSYAVVSAYKLHADNLKWSMSKMKPKKYGDKLDLTSGGEKLPQPIFNGASVQDKKHDSDQENLPA